MIYDILLDVSLNNNYIEVEADSEEEAKALLKQEIDKATNADSIHVWGSYVLSRKNYSYKRGAIYLIKKYSKTFPARCVDTRPLGGGGFEVVFEKLSNDKMFSISNEKLLTRVLKPPLCTSGTASDNCPADCQCRFMCFTRRGVASAKRGGSWG